ncbi:MAG: hypothetical protein ABSC30_04000 [Acidimicrobiales bacterium]
MDGDEHVEQSDFTGDRRAFLKRMAVFAFAAPVISSFALDSAAFAGTDHHDHKPNQYGYNNTNNPPPGQILNPYPPPNQYGYNNTYPQKPPPNQYGYNNTYPQKPPPNQYGYNNTYPENPPPKEPCGPDGKNKNQKNDHRR